MLYSVQVYSTNMLYDTLHVLLLESDPLAS